MINFKVIRPDAQTSYQIVCECGKVNVRGQTTCVDLRPFVCWGCLAALPNIMSLHKYRAYRIDYHKDGKMPPLFQAGMY